MIDFLFLVLARWLHFSALMIVFGCALFHLYSTVPATASARLAQIAAPVALASAFAWAGGSIVAVTGDAASLYDPTVLDAYFFDTQFGRLWLVLIAILVFMVLLVAAPGHKRGESKLHSATLSAVSGALLVGEAWLGHAAVPSALGPWPPVIAYGMHVLAAGAWLGGLPALADLAKAQIASEAVEATLWRFSTVGIISVALILVSGPLNTWFRITSVADAANTAYGRTLMIKIVLFAVLIGLAAENRLFALPRLRKAPESSRALATLKRNIVVEQVCGAAILLAAAVLGLLPPSG